MSAPTNHWKLGLFVVVGFFLGVSAIVYLGARSLQKESVSYTSYLDEAVTGLDVGSPVRFRGVTVGSVSQIDIAPDHRHIEVTYQLGVAALSGFGLATARGQHTRMSVPADLRVQLGSQGITGVKYVLIDFFDPRDHPPPKLSFPLPQNYIPATSSTMKDIESSVVRAVDEFPALAQQLNQALGQVDRLLGEVNDSGLTSKAAATFVRTDHTLAVLERKLQQIPVAQLSQDARTAMAKVNANLDGLHDLLARVDGDRGLVASVQRASDSLGDAAGNAQGFGTELEDTLRNLGEAAAAIVDLVDALERDSDMLIKGRTKASKR
jgi:paraquat-inducible protein B